MRGDTESRAASSKGARAETLAERGLPLEEQPVRRGAHKILQQAIKTHVAGAFLRVRHSKEKGPSLLS